MRQLSPLSSVLLVDDDDTTNFLNEQLLKRLGVVDRVLVARNGEEALMVLAEACGSTGKTCPVLILLDINMPVMNGIEFLEAYQPQLPARPIIVVALTTTSHPADIARLHELSIASIITKPLTKNKVDTILEQYF
jgi:CheY-like chemotaxis protein